MKNATLLMSSICFYLLLAIHTASGQRLPAAIPEEVGLATDRLGRLDNVMQQYIDNNQIAGTVVLIARKGKTAYLHALGMADIEAGKSMRTDNIFRIASMTKPITSAAVMMLYEEGKFLLSEPVSKYIPEFKNPRVAVTSSSDESYTLVPANQEITIRHLLNHTSGITYPTNNLVGQLYRNAGLSNLKQGSGTTLEQMKKLGTLPLVQHPGEAWHYGLNTDVLGALVEVWSGMTLDEFLKVRIFEPLGMKDTYFFLPPEKVSRLAKVYAPTDDGRMKHWPETTPFEGPRKFFSGGGGLCSTAPDYAVFLQMILNKGELNGKRLLSRKTVELMTTNSIGDMSILKGNVLGGDNFKFGLGFSVREGADRGSELESSGNIGWGGAWYTHSFVDLSEELVGVFMAQMKNSKERIYTRFVVLATQAIAD